MKSNRFDFLELGDQTQAPDTQEEEQESPVNLSVPAAPPARPSDQAIRTHASAARRNAPPRLAEVRINNEEERFPDVYTNAPKPVTGVVAHRLKPVEVFGARGVAAGEFNFPSGMAIDNSGILWVADSYNHRLQRITPDGGVAVVGARGLGRGQFMTPMDVAVDDMRSLFVVDQSAHRVQKFTSEGVLELVLGKPGSRPGELRSPMGVAVNSDTGEILVADTGNSRVQRFDSYGRFLAVLGESESQGAHMISNPQALAVDMLGRIYVADTLARRIVQFDPLGRFVGYYGGAIGPNQKPGSVNLNFDEPRSLAVSSAGRLFIADAQRGAGRISVIDVETGSLLVEMPNAGKTLGALARPSGIAISPAANGAASSGDVYVADTMNHRIIRFTWSG